MEYTRKRIAYMAQDTRPNWHEPCHLLGSQDYLLSKIRMAILRVYLSLAELWPTKLMWPSSRILSRRHGDVTSNHWVEAETGEAEKSWCVCVGFDEGSWELYIYIHVYIYVYILLYNILDLFGDRSMQMEPWFGFIWWDECPQLKNYFEVNQRATVPDFNDSMWRRIWHSMIVYFRNVCESEKRSNLTDSM